MAEDVPNQVRIEGGPAVDEMTLMLGDQRIPAARVDLVLEPRKLAEAKLTVEMVTLALHARGTFDPYQKLLQEFVNARSWGGNASMHRAATRIAEVVLQEFEGYGIVVVAQAKPEEEKEAESDGK